MNIGEMSPKEYAEFLQKTIIENKILEEQQQKLERYKNIIDELEKWLKDKSKGRLKYTNYDGVLNKLKELKGE